MRKQVKVHTFSRLRRAGARLHLADRAHYPKERIVLGLSEASGLFVGAKSKQEAGWAATGLFQRHDVVTAAAEPAHGITQAEMVCLLGANTSKSISVPGIGSIVLTAFCHSCVLHTDDMVVYLSPRTLPETCA